MRTAIGLMSGTSMDGIDVAQLRTDGLKAIEFGPVASFPYSAHDTQAISAALEDAAAIVKRDDRPGEMAGLERRLTQLHIDAVEQFLSDNHLRSEDIDVIGFHGQTVLHRPDGSLTVQLGDGDLLASQIGIDVVYDMRANDMANGGQGAPLIPVFHQALNSGDEVTAFVNIGGIANVTFVGPGQPPIAFDCGPGNALIDQWVSRNSNRSFDEGGELALNGKADRATIEHVMSDAFFNRAYPKSLDRNDFTLEPVPDLSLADGAATLAQLTVQGITKAADLAGLKPDRWIIAGGGAHNVAIMRDLAAALPGASVMTAKDAGLSIDFLEAQAWAYLAVRSLRGLALTFPTTTGCVEPVTGGVLARGKRCV